MRAIVAGTEPRQRYGDLDRSSDLCVDDIEKLS
jgi:hypothetical protein